MMEVFLDHQECVINYQPMLPVSLQTGLFENLKVAEEVCFLKWQLRFFLAQCNFGFYETEIKIWTGFGPVCNSENKNWAYYKQLLRVFFQAFMTKKYFF